MLLDLASNQIVNISALSGLTSLMELWLDINQIVDISALLNNEGLGAGAEVYLGNNYLDLAPGSPDMLVIEALQRQGVNVDYIPQNWR